MDNKAILRIFAAIFLSALFFWGVANAGSAALDRFVFAEKAFGDSTYIGGTDVSNTSKSEAGVILSQELAGWQSGVPLEVVYQDAVAMYPVEAAELKIEETLQRAETGEENDVIISLPVEATGTFLSQQFSSVTFSPSDVETINAELERAIGSGEDQVVLGSGLLPAGTSVVAETAFPYPADGSADLAKLVGELHGTQIEAYETFSFLELLSELQLAELTDAEATAVASALYHLVLQTNFTVEERSIGPAEPEEIPVGFEAVIDRGLGIDFSFSNSNDSMFRLRAERIGGSLYLSLVGHPFVYSYEVQVTGTETVEPRVIKEYSAFVASGKQVKEAGREGVRSEVVRIISDDEEIIETEPLSTDFYPPQHIVEVHPLAAANTAEAAPEEGTPPGTETDASQAAEGSKTGGESSGDTDKATDNNGTGDGSAQKDGGSSGKDSDSRSENRQENEPVYDKGGNLIHPGQ